MLGKYTFVKILNKGLVGLSHPIFGNQLWHEVKLRKPKNCIITGANLKAGDMAFSPITNGNNRMHRISRVGIDRLIKAQN